MRLIAVRHVIGILGMLLLVRPAGPDGALHAQDDALARPDRERLQRIDAAFAEWSGEAPGCVAAAERDGRLLFSRASGTANLEHAVPITRQTVFEAGSVSKQFTAAAVLLLVADGRIALTDDVRRYIPELPAWGAVVTIDHLLTHSSGVSDWGTIMFHAGWPRGDRVYTNEAALQVIARHPALMFAPGSFFSYSNSGYTLLAEIVERVADQTLPAFTEERLFRPLGMTSTRWRSDYRTVVPARATGYRKVEGSFIQHMPFEHTHGHAGLLTTVGDLLKWNRALSERRLGEMVTAQMERAAVDAAGRMLPYGRGLWVGSYRGTSELSHGGATAGYRAWLGRYPEFDLSVAVLCNGPANDVGLGRTIAAEFLPPARAGAPQATVAAAEPGAVAAVSPTVADAARLAGHFVREKLGTPFTVAASGDTLRISGEPAVQVAPDRFRISWGEFLFDGPDLLHELHADGSIFQTFRRIDGPLPSVEALRHFPGRYRSEAAMATYLVTIESGQLAIRVEDRPAVMFRFTPIGPDVFRSTGAVVRAHRNAAGRVTMLTLSTDRLRDLRFTRIEQAPGTGEGGCSCW